jgi:hypothetical protein
LHANKIFDVCHQKTVKQLKYYYCRTDIKEGEAVRIRNRLHAFYLSISGCDTAPVLYARDDLIMVGDCLKNKVFHDNTRKTYQMLLS